MSSRLKQKVKGALPWSVLESLVNGFVGLSQTFILTWFLNPEDMGRAAIALAFVGIVEIVASLGMAEAVIGARSVHTRVSDTAFTAIMSASVLAAALCALAAGPIAQFYGEPDLIYLILLAICTLPLNAFVAIPTALLTRKMRAAVVTLRITGARVATLVAMGALAFSGYGPWAIVGGTVIGSAITVLIMVPVVMRLPRLRFDKHIFYQLVAFGSALSLERLLWGAMTRVFWLIIGYIHGPAILGLFQFAQRLVDETANLIQTFSIRFGLAFFSAMKRSGRSPAEAFLKATRLICVVAAPVFVGIAIVLPDAIGSIFDEKWAPSAIIAQVAALGWVLAFPRVLVGPMLRAENRSWIIVGYAIAAAGTTLVAGLLTEGHGLTFIGFAWVARHLVGLPWSLYAVRKYIGISYINQVGPYSRPLIATGVMAAAVLAVSYLTPDLSHLQRFILEVVAGGVVFAVMLVIVDRPSIRLIRDLVKK